MSEYLNKKYGGLKPYTPGEQPDDREYIKLNQNESPYPPSPMVKAAITGELIDGLAAYEDPCAADLAEAIADYYHILPENVIPTGGSDEVLGYAFMAYGCDGGKVLYPDATYGFYKVFAQLVGSKSVVVPLAEDWSITPEDYYNAGGMVVIANPNAPTGLAISLEQIAGICEHNADSIVLIDEAYADFSGATAVGLIEKYHNLIVVQTFSKSRCLAGARIGFAVACKELIEDLNKMKFSLNPFDIDDLAIKAGCAAMKDVGYFKDCVGKVIATRQRVTKALEAMGCTVLDSKTNFVFVDPNAIGAAEYCEKLREHGILARYYPGGRTDKFLRVSIGTDAQMDEYLKATGIILGK